MLARKRCAACQRTCYSFSKAGAWFCPHCGVDLAKAPFEQVDASVANVLPLAASQLEELNRN